MQFLFNEISSVVSAALLLCFIAYLLISVAGGDGAPLAKVTMQTTASIAGGLIQLVIGLVVWLFTMSIRALTLFNPKLQPVIDHMFGDGSSTHGRKK